MNIKNQTTSNMVLTAQGFKTIPAASMEPKTNLDHFSTNSYLWDILFSIPNIKLSLQRSDRNNLVVTMDYKDIHYVFNFWTLSGELSTADLCHLIKCILANAF